MARYENVLKCAQIKKLVDEKRFRKAARILETMDISTVKSVTDLNAIAEVFIKTDQYDEAKQVYERIYARAKSRRVLYRLIYLALRNEELTQAERYYEEYVQLDPDNSDRLILRYRIDKAKGVSRSDLIKTLEQLKREDYMEEWAYELAKQYHREGLIEACVRECSDIILWFGEGEIVEKAMRLKEFHTGKSEDNSRRYFDTPENIDAMLNTQPIPILDTSAVSAPVTSVPQTDEDSVSGIPAPAMESVSNEEEKQAHTIEIVSDIADLIEPELPPMPTSMPVHPPVEEPPVEEPFPHIQLTPEQEAELMHHSQSGTGITLDLAREISAIVEAEQNQQFQLTEKQVKVEMEDTNAYPITESLRLTPEEEAKLAAFEEKETVTTVPLDNVADRMGQALDRMMARRIPDDTKNDTSLEEITDNTPSEPKEAETLSVSEIPEETQSQPVAEISEDTSPQVNAATKPVPEIQTAVETQVTDIQMTPEIQTVTDTPSAVDTQVADDTQTVAEAQVADDVQTEQPSGTEAFPPITTMALRLSFQDILTMIGADPEPTHFVLIAKDADTTLGVTKQIVKTINTKGYINASQIARITADKLNRMDLNANAGKLRGGCLLVENASNLSIPTVGSLIQMMDEFGPEVVVALADEGDTLEALFERALALNRRFKYVIDITNYAMEDYQ